jgi:hypothetical protein
MWVLGHRCWQKEAQDLYCTYFGSLTAYVGNRDLINPIFGPKPADGKRPHDTNLGAWPPMWSKGAQEFNFKQFGCLTSDSGKHKLEA